jgi:cell division protein FtsX
VSARSDLRLGLRLAVAGGRPSLTRLLLIASGIALGVGLLLSVLGIFPAEAAVERRQAARQFDLVEGDEAAPPDHLLLDYAETIFGEEPIAITYVAPVGQPSRPPWLAEIPGRGEIVASPDLAELLASPDGALLRPRLPGEVVDTLDDRWLLHPGELVAYVGAVAEDLSPHREVATGLGMDPEHHGGAVISVPAIERPLFQVSFLVCVGLLIPIVVFVVTGARLSASARESRLAAIRLVGGTPGQARLAAAGESLLAGLLGCGLGIAFFLLARPVLAEVAPPGDRWFPSDIAPPPPLFLAVLIGVLALSVGASLVSLRRVVVTPLGVVRGGGKRVRIWWRWAMLAAGLGGLLLAMLQEQRIVGNDRIVIPFVMTSFGLTALGAAAAAPVAGSAVAQFIAKLTAGPGIILGARRLQVDPRTAGRTVGGIVVVVIAAAITSLFAGVYTQQLGESQFPSSLRASTVIVEPVSPEPIDRDAIQGVRGVTEAAPVWRGYTRHGYQVLVADCDALDVTVVEDLPTCGPGDAFVNGRLYDQGDSLKPEMRIHFDLAPDLRVDMAASNPRRVDVELGEFHNILLPLASSPIDLWTRVAPSILYVATDGDPGTVERIRNALQGPDAPLVHPRGELEDYADEVGVLVDAAVTLGIGITFAIAAATMLVTAVDAVGERRRSLATLAALGASTGVLRRALTVETALPMLAGVVLGLASAIAGTWMVFEAITSLEDVENPPPIPWRSLGYVVVFAIVATVVATIATFPSLGRAIRPDSLRTE